MSKTATRKTVADAADNRKEAIKPSGTRHRPSIMKPLEQRLPFVQRKARHPQPPPTTRP